jgi:hypothetical protein
LARIAGADVPGFADDGLRSDRSGARWRFDQP